MSDKKTQVDTILTPPKKDNEVFHSRYFSHSQKKVDNPQAYHTFFHDHPFQKFHQDISILKPISYQCPNANLLNRKYLIVEDKVIVGKPLTPQQFEQLRSKKQKEPEVVTWGMSESKDLNLKLKSVAREKIEVQKEDVEKGMCWCCAAGDVKNSKSVLVNDV